jgi:hypothetical protein
MERRGHVVMGYLRRYGRFLTPLLPRRDEVCLDKQLKLTYFSSLLKLVRNLPQLAE